MQNTAANSDDPGNGVRVSVTHINRGRSKLAASPEPMPSHREVSPELSRLLHLYVDRFNKRDWEGLRELISADAQLRVADRFAGPCKESPYFGNYERQTVPWRLAVADVDGELAVVALHQHRDEWRTASVARVEVVGPHVTRIVDYWHCAWVLSAATSVVVPDLPEHFAGARILDRSRVVILNESAIPGGKKMHTKDAIKFALTVSNGAVLSVIDQMSGAATTFPTPNGGCHPLWVLGHLTLVEGSIPAVLLGDKNPAAEWQQYFGENSEPVADASAYPPFAKVREKYLQLREQNLKLLESLSEADLDKPTKAPPKGLEQEFATYGQSFLVLALHQTMHRGNVTDARRAALATRVAS